MPIWSHSMKPGNNDSRSKSRRSGFGVALRLRGRHISGAGNDGIVSGPAFGAWSAKHGKRDPETGQSAIKCQIPLDSEIISNRDLSTSRQTAS